MARLAREAFFLAWMDSWMLSFSYGVALILDDFGDLVHGGLLWRLALGVPLLLVSWGIVRFGERNAERLTAREE